jgi:hypothetical protein
MSHDFVGALEDLVHANITHETHNVAQTKETNNEFPPRGLRVTFFENIIHLEVFFLLKRRWIIFGNYFSQIGGQIFLRN